MAQTAKPTRCSLTTTATDDDGPACLVEEDVGESGAVGGGPVALPASETPGNALERAESVSRFSRFRSARISPACW
jgi:hypothetical protein